MKTNTLSHLRAVCACLCVVVGVSFLSGCADDATEPVVTPLPTVYNTSTTISGKTYAQWSAEWWKWAFQTRVHDASNPALITHPLLDETGSNAAVGQDGASSVFFLGGKLFENDTLVRNVTISSSKNIFVALINVQVDTTGNWNKDSMLGAINIVETFPVTLTATLDGKAIDSLSKYLVRSGDFSATLPADNVYQLRGANFPAGTVMPMMSTGYWLMLSPLSKGNHVLHFTGMVPKPMDVSQDITYNITVN